MLRHRKDESQVASACKLDKDEMDEVTEAFQFLSDHKTNTLNVQHLPEIFIALGLPDPTDNNEITYLLRQIGKDGIFRPHNSKTKTTDHYGADCDVMATITFDEFLCIVTPKIKSRDDRLERKKLFDLFDEDGNGYISIQNLRKVTNDLNMNFQDVELQQMMDEADNDGDGVLKFEEFERVMKSCKKNNILDDLSSDEENSVHY